MISPFVGGAFGSALRTWPHVTLAAHGGEGGRSAGAAGTDPAATGQQYRLPSDQPAAHRPGQRQGRTPGRDRARRRPAGRALRGIRGSHSGAGPAHLCLPERAVALPAGGDGYQFALSDARAWRCRQASWRIEMAMDELAYALQMDPLELRLRNYAEKDEAKGLPWSSKELRACYKAAAERFGWHKRTGQPGSMRDGRVRVGLWHGDGHLSFGPVAWIGACDAVWQRDRGGAQRGIRYGAGHLYLHDAGGGRQPGPDGGAGAVRAGRYRLAVRAGAWRLHHHGQRGQCRGGSLPGGAEEAG